MRDTVSISTDNPRFFSLEKLRDFNGAGSTAFLHDFYEQSTLIGAVESWTYESLRCTPVSCLNRRAATWLHAEPKPAIYVQFPENIHYLGLSKPSHHKVLFSQSDAGLEEPKSEILW